MCGCAGSPARKGLKMSYFDETIWYKLLENLRKSLAAVHPILYLAFVFVFFLLEVSSVRVGPEKERSERQDLSPE
jgi:hypothetical protein